MGTMEEALRLLSSSASSERLRGARLVQDCAKQQHLTIIQELRRRESDSWVRAALDRAILRLQSTGTVERWEQADLPQSTDNDDVAAEAIQMVTELVLHEVSPQLRRLTMNAENDLAGRFAGSSTQGSIVRLQEFLEVLRRVHEAAGAPNIAEFDLTDLVQGIAGRPDFSSHRILVTRSDPVTVRGDRDLVDLAVSNGLSNALEASAESSKPVIINFGRTDTDAWVSVLDEGVGLPPGADYVWKPGRTNKGKDAHFGWGLTIARRSIRSLHGSIFLSPREPVGASFEIRWPVSGG